MSVANRPSSGDGGSASCAAWAPLVCWLSFDFLPFAFLSFFALSSFFLSFLSFFVFFPLFSACVPVCASADESAAAAHGTPSISARASDAAAATVFNTALHSPYSRLPPRRPGGRRRRR